MIVLHQVKLNAGQKLDELIYKCAKLLKTDFNNITKFKILRESLDARKKPEIFMVYEIGISLAGINGIEAESRYIKKIKGLLADCEEISQYEFPYKSNCECKRPVIIGFGPAGIFCALLLSKAGFRPIVLERGKSVEERQKDVDELWTSGKLNTESNVLFGEGGAGTFSDGKLNTLVKGSKNIQRFVMETFTSFGADPEICYSYKPHIGTDVLSEIIPKMRNEIIKNGGDVLFSHKVSEFIISDGKITGLKVITGNETKLIECENVCLAIGHSARDTFRTLSKQNINMESKPFAIGVRCEHKQDMINRSQYGDKYDLKNLGAATYKLTAKVSNGRGVYSFCMCPGGYVVNSSSQEGRLCVNGMSYHNRAGEKANSAIIVTVNTDDFSGEGPLKGVEWQEELEKKAYDYKKGMIPVQLLKDFKEKKESKKELLKPSIKGLWSEGDLNRILPEFISNSIKEGFEQFGKKIKGFDNDDTLLIGLESRTSSPVKINRNEKFESNIKGLFPCGEGAGYAGGITSAAVDGCKVAEAIAKKILRIEE